MGKKGTIKIIAGLMGGMTAHAILIKYTNRPESVNHLKSEIDNYKGTISDYIEEFNWNEDDRKRIKEESLKSFKNELKEPHFSDVKFPMSEALELIDKTLKEMLI